MSWLVADVMEALGARLSSEQVEAALNDTRTAPGDNDGSSKKREKGEATAKKPASGKARKRAGSGANDGSSKK
eukprot:COSAG02_NODE_53181_length_303_cov_1.000000_1_plen_72_part_10